MIACVLLQAVYGGNSHVPSQFFDTKLWAVAPPKEKPVLVSGTNEQWETLAKKWAAELS